MLNLMLNNENEYISIANNLVEDLVKILDDKLKYQNILILGINNQNIEMELKKYRQIFNVAFSQNLDSELLEKSHCVVLADESICKENISKVVNANKLLILICNEYPNLDLINNYEYKDKIKNCLLRIIINNKTSSNQTINYCKYMMEYFSYKVKKLEDFLNSLFFNNQNGEVNYSLSNQLNIKTFEEFDMKSDLELLFREMNKSKNIMNYIYSCNFSQLNNISYKFIISQIVLMLYKNFIAYINPNLMGEIEEFSFDYKKFWFVQSACKNIILNEIEMIERLHEEVKFNMIQCNIDFFFKNSQQYSNFSCKSKIKEFAKNYNGPSLLKVMYEMGLLKF